MLHLVTFLFVLSILVIAHEFGHFLMARLVGIRVEKFSIGFGPVLVAKTWGQTQFCVSLLPLGGFVKLSGESTGESQGAAWEYSTKSFYQKAAVILAGPLMNALLAFFLFTAILATGEPTPTTKIGKVIPHMPAAEAGVLEGDRVLTINGKNVQYWQDLLAGIQKSEGKILLTLERAGKSVTLSVVPKGIAYGADVKHSVKMPFIGIASSGECVSIRHGAVESVALGAGRVWKLSAMLFSSLGLMISGVLPFKDSMAGPIGIFYMTGEAAARGVAYLFYFMGSLSVSLFVLNLLPIPVLDGGVIFFLIIEKIKGSPLKESVKEWLTQIGLVLLLILMGFVIFQDLNRYPVLKNLKNAVLSMRGLSKETVK